jgi:hypothetical protein
MGNDRQVAVMKMLRLLKYCFMTQFPRRSTIRSTIDDDDVMIERQATHGQKNQRTSEEERQKK